MNAIVFLPIKWSPCNFTIAQLSYLFQISQNFKEHNYPIPKNGIAKIGSLIEYFQTSGGHF